MLIAKKIKLNPTPEQEILFWKSAGTARFAYNYYLSENEKYYKHIPEIADKVEYKTTLILIFIVNKCK